MAVAVCKQKQHGQQEWPIFYTVTIKYLCRSYGKRKNVTNENHSSCWICFCTLINQFIKLEQRKLLRKYQTTNHRFAEYFVISAIVVAFGANYVKWFETRPTTSATEM